MKKKQVLVSHRAHIFYSGRVHGVGFRHTAECIALELGLKGWVKNLSDGRVEIICEGKKTDIEALLCRITDSIVGCHIKDCDVSWEKPTQEFTDFCVEFCY